VGRTVDMNERQENRIAEESVLVDNCTFGLFSFFLDSFVDGPLEVWPWNQCSKGSTHMEIDDVETNDIGSIYPTEADHSR